MHKKDYSVHLYYVCQILVFNLISTMVTDMKGIIRIDRLPLGLGTDLWKWYCTRLRPYHFHFSSYHDPWAVCISWILPSISVTIIYVNECWLPLTKYGELD